MELTLKKALKLRSKLEVFVNEVHLPLTAELSIFVDGNRGDPTSALNKAGKEVLAKLDAKLRASHILASLRTAVAKANSENDVERLLAETAHLERTIAFARLISNAQLQEVPEAVKGELSVLYRQATEERPQGMSMHRGMTKAGVFSVVTEEMRDKAKSTIAEASRQKEELDDARAAVNISTRIRIADADAEFLREHAFV